MTPSTAKNLTIWRSCVSLLSDASAFDNKKYEAATQLSEDLELIVEHNQTHRQFFEQTIVTFLTYLETTEPKFVSESYRQKLRKLILEMIQRLPPVDALREHVPRILQLMFRLFEIENEENVGVILRIIIELHKSYKPEFINEIFSFLEFIKAFYSDMKNNYDLNAMFEEKKIVVSEFNDQVVEKLLVNIHTITTVELESNQSSTSTAISSQTNAQYPDTPNPNQRTFNILPRAKLSLKVVAEVPVMVAILYQQHKSHIQVHVSQFIPLIIDIITLRPPESVRSALNSDKIDKEIYVEFLSAQSKALSFIVFIARIFQDIIASHSEQLIQGVFMLLEDCPHEVASLRKDMLTAVKHMLQTSLRARFIEHIPTLFDENILIGSGWTACETLRPIAYHTLADMLHNSKANLQLTDIASAINMFSKNLHDETLSPQIQLMSCKLLITLTDSIKMYASNERDVPIVRDLLMRIIEVFVLKFKFISNFHLPPLMQKWKAQQGFQQFPTMDHQSLQSSQVTQTTPLSQQGNQTRESNIGNVMSMNDQASRDERLKIEFTSLPLQVYNVNDCKNAVKTLILGIKTVMQIFPSYRSPALSDQMLMPLNAKLLHPKETIEFFRFVRYALKALDIYMIAPTGSQIVNHMNKQHMSAQQNVRSKEEKEILENFANIFTMLHPQTFQEIFSKSIDYLIERMHQNSALQIVVPAFLATPPTSPIFATILLEYLIVRIEEIGSNEEMSSLYLRLFKMVFGSVSFLAVKNEQMLKPHLQNIVNKSMELALGAKDPYNYFLLLRALFRSIGNGNHDLLYQEFLPLLPNLLQGLNSLQSGLHKQHLKDLFVELCLTVPVRLSSLLPFLPMLMDPLVSALNGTQGLIGQGLRTLELCVDNLQPDFLYEHIQPVRAELMQALWRTIRNMNETAQTSFRVLGKFGGGNRKMMVEPQRLNYVEQRDSKTDQATTIIIHFPDQKVSIDFPVDKIVQAAFDNLKQNNVFPSHPSLNSFYLKHSWEVLKGVIILTLSSNFEHGSRIKSFFSNPNLHTAHIPLRRENIYKCPDERSRLVYQNALTGMFMAMARPELKESVNGFVNFVIRHHIMLSICQHLNNPPAETPEGMDPFVLVDALNYVIGHEEKKQCEPGYYVLAFMIDTAAILLGSKERACELPLISYLVKSMYKLCYERAWYSKTGGCKAIRYFTDNMPLIWILKFQSKFVKALLYVMRDLTGEVSSGAVDLSQTNLEKLIRVCGKPLDRQNTEDPNLVAIHTKSFNEVVELLIREIISPNLFVRTQATKSLELIATLNDKTVAQIMEPFRGILEMLLPLFSTQRETNSLEKQPVKAQIGIIYGATFCTNLEPRIFKIDTSIDKHRHYIEQLMKICDGDDATLKKLPCYNKVTTLAPVKTAALHALSSCHYLDNYQTDIFKILFKSTDSHCADFRTAAYTCLNDFVSKVSISTCVVQEEIQPFLTRLQDSHQWDLKAVERILSIARLFPNIFDEIFCNKLYEHLTNISTSANADLKTQLTPNEHVHDRTKSSHDKMKICAGLIEILVLINNIEQSYMSKLMALVIKIETSIIQEPGSLLREPLKKFLRRFPDHTMSILMSERNLHEDQVYRLIKYILKGPDGEIFRNVLNQQTYFSKLLMLTSNMITVSEQSSQNGQVAKRPVSYSLRYQAVVVISTLIKYDEDWLISRPQLAEKLQQIWTSDEFHAKHAEIELIDFAQWNEPKLMVKCLLNYFQRQPNSIELLFQLLKVFMHRYLCDFEFLRSFLEKTVIKTYSIEWKREAFAKFVSIFPDANYSQKLKAKILQFIIIPSFAHSFEKGLGEALLGGPPQPERENPSNLVNMFINKIIDPICSGDRKFIVSDEVRILLLQFSCLLVDQASPHIHEISNRSKQSTRLKKLVTFAWPCLKQNKVCVDPVAKYHGHLLLSHIIAKFAVHKDIITQVFHSLLKAFAPEARVVVRQALEILLPAMPHKLKGGNKLLTSWTKKIIIEDGHLLAQLLHMLQLLVRHYRLYYPIRIDILPHMISSIQRLGYTANASLEHKKIAIDLCEIIIRWEMQRLREVREKAQNQSIVVTQASNVDSQANSSIQAGDQSNQSIQPVASQVATSPQHVDSPSTFEAEKMNVDSDKDETAVSNDQQEEPMETKPTVPGSMNGSETNSCSNPQVPILQAATPTPSEISQVTPQPSSPTVDGMSSAAGDAVASDKVKKPAPESSSTDPLEQKYIDSILNTLLRLACHLNPNPNEMPQVASLSFAEGLSKRCVMLIKTALRPEIWSEADLKFAHWMDKLLCTVETPQQCSVANVCTALEILSFLCITLKQDAVLNSFKHLSKGIIACINSSNSKVIRFVSSLIQRLMSVFPTQSNSNQPEELEVLYSSIYRIIHHGLSSYETAAQPTSPVTLFSTLMVLKAACVNNASYVDRIMPVFIRVLQKMSKEHTSQAGGKNVMTELLILSLDLVKNRLGIMSPEARKQFNQQILSSLIESPATDTKVLRSITKTVEEWIKQKSQTQGPNLKEKMLLLIKLMLHIEKRLHVHIDPKEIEANMELNVMFLELINFVYRNDELKATDYIARLEQAFMSGLRCVQPQIRSKFFEVFDQSVKPKLYERLMYIVCAQNWQSIGHHFWVQQCIEFILIIASPELPIQTTNSASVCLPIIPTSLDIGSYNQSDYDNCNSLLSMLSDTNSSLSSFKDAEFVPNNEDHADLLEYVNHNAVEDNVFGRKNLLAIVNRQLSFYEDSKKARVGDFLKSISQLCHLNAELASGVWISMLPRIWKTLNDQQMTLLGREIIPFLCSGAHILQKECHPSAIGTFMEAIARFKPSIQMRPILLKYLGKNHNVWHRSALMLEDLTKARGLDVTYPLPAKANKGHVQNSNEFDIITLNHSTTISEEALECLSDILELLREDDLWYGLWHHKARYAETRHALCYENHGMFNEAQLMFESAMERQRQEFDETCVIKPGMKSENRIWEHHWIRCSKELNQWDSLLEYGTVNGCSNPILVLDSAWRVPNWPMMKEALTLVEDNCPYDIAWRVALYKGYNFICNNEDIQLQPVDEMVQLASNYCIQTWRKLPHVVSHVHMTLLQAAQQVMELHEAKQIQAGVMPTNMNRSDQTRDMKAIVKTWRNRLPILTDDLSHWSDIFTWRQHHYQAIVSHFETHSNQMSQVSGHFIPPDTSQTTAMLGAHASAQSIIHFGKIARKQGLIDVCLDSISRLHTIPSVPIVDCFQKIKQQVKCYLQMPTSPDQSELLDGLEIIECTNLKFLTKEMVAEFHAMKGIFLTHLGRHEDANKAFSAATNLHDSHAKAWAGWGELMEVRFTQEFTQPSETAIKANFAARQMNFGVSAMTCYLEACKHLPEPKARKYIAKILWLLSFDDERAQLAELINKYCQQINAQNWLAWIPQLLQCLMRNEGEYLRNLLIVIGRSNPQAVYFPIRTLYFTLKAYFKMRQPHMHAGSPMSRFQPQTPVMAESPTTSSGNETNIQTSSATNQATTASTTVNIATSQPPNPAQTPLQDISKQQQMTAQQQQPTAMTQPHLASNLAQQSPQFQSSIGLPSPQTINSSTMPTTPNQGQTFVSSTIAPGVSQPTLIQQLQQPPVMSSPGGPLMHPQTPQSRQLAMAMHPQQLGAPLSLVRCSEIMKKLLDMHPTTLSSLEGIVDQMNWFKEYSYEEVQRQIQQVLLRCYAFAFENSRTISTQTINVQTFNFVRKLVATFGFGVAGNIQNSNYPNTPGFTSAADSGRVQAAAQDLEFQQTKVRFRADFDEALLQNMKLITLISKLKSWINILNQKNKLMPKTYLIEDKCIFLSNFSQHTADVELPGESLLPKNHHYYVRIARFLPEVEVAQKHNTAARRIFIRGHNGKVYPYLVLSDSCFSDARREERVLQLLRLLNHYLLKKKETARRFLNFTVPRVVAITHSMRLVEDNPASLSLLDILKNRINHNRIGITTLDHDSPITEYYDKIVAIQNSGNQVTLKNLNDIFFDVQNNMVPTTVLKEWAGQTYIDATDYWAFRSQFTIQTCLASFSEYVLHLTRLMPDMMYIHQDTGLVNISYYKFDLDEANGEFQSQRPVPFRLTPNMSEFITKFGTSGLFASSMIAAARCFVSPNFKVQAIIRAILRDEMLYWLKKNQDSPALRSGQISRHDFNSEQLVNMVNKATDNIFKRLNQLASTDKPLDSQVPHLIKQASGYSQLSQMDPAWHPWL